METRFIILLTDARAYAARYELQRRRWSRTAIHEYEIDVPFMPQKEKDLISLGQQLASRLRHDYPDGVTCRLVIPANWCLIHRVELPGSRWSKSAAEYEFEQYIPVDLEELTCTSIRLNPRDALVVAVFTDSLHEFLTVLEENLVIVEAVNVDAMLLSQDRDTRGADGSYGLILADDKRLTIMAVDARRGTVGQLRTTGMPKAASTDVLSRQVITAASFLKEPCAHWRVLPLSGTAPAKDIVRILESMGHSAEIDSKERTVEHVLSAASTAGDMLDLRTGALAYSRRWTPIHRRLVQCAIAVAVLSVAWAFQLRVENITYARAIEEARPLQGQIYEAVFPGKSAPPEAALRLRSECIKLEGLTEQTGANDGDLKPSGLEAFKLLHEVTARIPPDLKLHVSEILLDDRGIRLAGRTTTHGAAGELVKELNRIPTLVVDPPRTTLRKDHTVDFRLSAKRATDDSNE